MRSIRCLTTGLALLVTLPALVSAQEGRQFQNSWFWGLKAGNMTYWTKRVSHAQAQNFGGEWLITRHKGGLLVGMDHTDFGNLFDDDDGELSELMGEPVMLKTMRRLSFTGVVFPKNFSGIRPYGGVGLSFAWLDADVQSGSAIPSDTLRTHASTVAPIFMVGVQVQYRRFSLFGQGSTMMTRSSFLVNENPSYFVETGIRYNFGSSIERP